MAPVLVTPRMDAHRRDQAALGGRVAATAAQIVANRLDPADPDRGWAGLLAELLALLRGGRSVSEQLAMEFYRYLRDLEDATGDPPNRPDIPFPTNSAVGSMIYTGPRMAKAMLRRGDDKDLAARVGVMVGRSAMRHTLNGGRETMRRAVTEDPAAWGWARMTDADPCDFCEMLAGRGAVYKSARTAGDELNRYHDGCACSVIAVFKGPEPAPARRSSRGADGLTDRQRRVIEGVHREVHGTAGGPAIKG